MRIAILTMLWICALARLGMCGPTTRAGDPPDSGLVGRFGDLRQIKIEGSRATLAAIDVRGAERNTSREVLAFLQLHEGQTIDLEQLEAAQSTLWESGGFKRHVVWLRPD